MITYCYQSFVSGDGQVDFNEFMTILGPKLLSSETREGFLGSTIDTIFWQVKLNPLKNISTAILKDIQSMYLITNSGKDRTWVVTHVHKKGMRFSSSDLVTAKKEKREDCSRVPNLKCKSPSLICRQAGKTKLW